MFVTARDGCDNSNKLFYTKLNNFAENKKLEFVKNNTPFFIVKSIKIPKYKSAPSILNYSFIGLIIGVVLSSLYSIFQNKKK